MEDMNEDELRQAILDTQSEVDEWKAKYKALELKKRESDLSLNKIKTEINSLRSVDKLWKESAKSVYLNLSDMKNQFDAQADIISKGLDGITKAGERVSSKVPYCKKLQTTIAALQKRIALQEESIMSLNSKIYTLTVELEDKTDKVQRLSQGIDEEVERLLKPIREKLADSMLLIMKEKAARAQERREIADLWPKSMLMPSILMKNRFLNKEEQDRRVKLALEKNASFALSHEIRANVTEAKMWVLKYDDYGRAFYEHMQTGETNWEPPEILSYKPPSGRDEMGNIISTEENSLLNWDLKTDYKGEVYYQHKKSGEISYISPAAYPVIPKGKSKEIIVSEAAQIVLSFIKEKILKHIEYKKQQQFQFENPLTPEDKKKKLKEEKNKTPEQKAIELAAAEAKAIEDEAEPLDLSIYQYDIETVELLATITGEKPGAEDDPSEIRQAKRQFLTENHLRKFDPELFICRTLVEIDIPTITVNQLRAIVEEFAVVEEKLDKQTARIRDNMKDFTFLLIEKQIAEDKQRAEDLKVEIETREREEKLLIAQMLKEKEEQERKQKLEAEKLLKEKEILNLQSSLDGESPLDLAKDSLIEDENIQPTHIVEETTSLDESNSIDKSLNLNSIVSNDNPFIRRNKTKKNKSIVPPDEAKYHDFSDEEDSDTENTHIANNSVDDIHSHLTNYASLLLGSPTILDQEMDFSSEIIQLSTNLVNFSLFCGFTNTHINDAPNESTVDYSLQLDNFRNKRKCKKINFEDDWLSTAFFISCSSAQLDQIRENSSNSYDAIAGLMPIGPQDSENLVLINDQNVKFERPLSKSFTYSTDQADEYSQSKYQLWKTKQLMTDIVRHQVQKEAIQLAYKHRTEVFSTSCNIYSDKQQSHIKPKGIPIVRINVKSIKYNPDVKFTSITSNLYFVQLKIGNILMQTTTQNPNPHGINWENLKLNGVLPINDVQLLDLFIEVLDENPNEPQQAFVGIGVIAIDKALGSNIARDMTFELIVYNNLVEKVKIGSLNMLISLDVEKPLSEMVADVKNLETLEINLKKSEVIRLKMDLDAVNKINPFELTNEDGLIENIDHNSSLVANTEISQVSIKSSKEALHDCSQSMNDEKYRSISTLVSDFRGDGIDFMKLLTADVSVSDLKRIGTDISKQVTQNVPNFTQTTLFMEKKTNRHRWEIDQIMTEINEFYSHFNALLSNRTDNMTKLANDLKMKHSKVFTQSENIKTEVLKHQKNVLDLRNPHPEPKQPIFPDLGLVPYITKIPPSGGLDSRGKKKKKLPKEEVKTLIDKIESGESDGLDIWVFSTDKFPDQAQALKLTKAIQVRNSVLDIKRKDEMTRRDRVTEGYQTEMEKWNAIEQKRMKDLQKAKKDCRKYNLKYDCVMNVVNCAYREHQTALLDLRIINDLKVSNDKAKERFKFMRFKQNLEYSRQQKYLDSQKRRLLKALKARRYSLDIPANASDDLTYASLCRQAETALRTLRYEIFECKQILTSEGCRLRILFQEEYRLCTNELARLKVSKEILSQRDCYNKILERYKFEIVNLYVEIEKHKLKEAESDDIGIGSVDDLGERFKSDKVWLSKNVNNCQKVIDICLAKINLTDGLGNSTGSSQKILLDVLATKWGSDFMPVRDSWSEAADYERAQQLLEDTLLWAQRERRNLENFRNQNERDKLDWTLQLDALRTQQNSTVVSHESQTKTITVGSVDVINVIKKQLDIVREESKAKILEMDHNIINLSRECQKVREELLAQGLVFDEKLKVLWAFIHTMQTAVQQIAAKMEIVIEERDKVVIESKLVADRMRAQLRIERKHCSNLLFIIQSQRGNVKFLKDVIAKLAAEHKAFENQQAFEKSSLRKEIYEQIFTFTRLSTDVDSLFEFFVARLSNLAGARTTINNQLAKNGAAQVLAALCKSPRPLIRKFASRAIGAMGWDGFVETRILLWDAAMYWKIYKSRVIAKEIDEFRSGFDRFKESGKVESIINLSGDVEEFVPSGNMSLRTIIKQRRQWALRAARRREGPNTFNQRQLNVRDGVIPALLDMCLADGTVDWEISRNAALAISIASNEPQNHYEITQSGFCVEMIIKMCKGSDTEVQTHAAVTIANLCHKDEKSQLVFGKSGAIEPLVKLCLCPVVDVLEAVTSALSNLTCYCDFNCLKVLESDGVNIIISVITHSYSENLLDLDQNDEVQANAAETLANISKFSLESTAKYFKGKVIDALVVLCASNNIMVKKHIPLVIGNIGQVESCREEIGLKGGIEALFLTLEDIDTIVQANVLWSLCNLMWHPPNQERAGRFISEVLKSIQSPWDPVRTQAITLLANMLYYNNDNRIRFLESEGAFEMIINFVNDRTESSLVEGSLRALLSLSYIDNIALWLGTTGRMIPVFIKYLVSPWYSRDSMRYCLEILCNLCLHNANRQIIYDNGGVDAIVSLHIDADLHIRELSVKIIEYLNDITPAEVLARMKQNIGLDRMVKMASSTDPLIRAVAAESIGEEIWHDSSKQMRAQEIGGVDALLAIVANPEEPIESLLPAIWSLRNIIHDQTTAKNQFAYRDGISIMNSLLKQAYCGIYEEQTEKIFEAVLLCLTTVSFNEVRISRRLLSIILPKILDLADGKISNDLLTTSTSETKGVGSNLEMEPAALSHQRLLYVKSALRGESVQSLAKSLLLQLAPYNYVVCRNCGRKQDLHGQSCYNCGNRLIMEADMFEIEQRKAYERQNPLSSVKKIEFKNQNLRSNSSNTHIQSLKPLQSLSTSAGYILDQDNYPSNVHNTNNINHLKNNPKHVISKTILSKSTGTLEKTQNFGQ